MKAVSSSLALAGVVSLALAVGFAQNAFPNVIKWTEGAPNATSDTKDNTKIEGLKTDSIHIFVSLAEIKETEYNRVWVQVSNWGTAPVTLNPQLAVLLKGDKSVKAEAPDKAAGSIQRFGEAKSQELSSAHCNSMIATGCQPTNTQIQVSKQVLANANGQAEWVRNNGLKEKTLAPGEEAQGAIVFKKDKKGMEYVLHIPVGDQVFEFPLSAQNKIPSFNY